MKLYSKVLIVLSLNLQLNIIVQAVTTTLASYGEYCSRSITGCKTEKFFVCENNKCTCYGSMVYEDALDTCAIGSDHECIHNQIYRSARDPSSSSCVSNAKCSPENTCVCNDGFYKTANKTCREIKNPGQTCTFNEDCRGYEPDSTLPNVVKCSDGVCKCNHSIAKEYNFSDPPFCGRKLGLTCNRNDCEYGAVCSDQTCKCNALQYFQSEYETCEKRKTHSQICGSNDECDYEHQHLICGNGTCQCKPGTKLNPKSAPVCLLTPGATCKPSRTVHECFPNAVCENSICTCTQGTKPGNFLKDDCYVMEGQSCFGDEDDSMTTRTCLPGLACHNGVCSCPQADLQVYNYGTEKCQGSDVENRAGRKKGTFGCICVIWLLAYKFVFLS